MTSTVVSTDGWSAELPAGWLAPDASRRSYLEAPDGSAGAYFREVVVRVGDLENAIRDVRAAELEALPGGLLGGASLILLPRPTCRRNTTTLAIVT